MYTTIIDQNAGGPANGKDLNTETGVIGLTALLEQVRDYLDAQEWNYDIRGQEDDEYMIMRMNLKTVDACTTVMRSFDEDSFVVYSIFPIKVPEDKRPEIAEFITRANYGLNHGNFEMDFDDGEIRYKTTAIWGDLEVPERHMDRVINLGFCMLDRYGSGILSVLYGGADAAAANDKIENSDD